jgi:hypothetical protein
VSLLGLTERDFDAYLPERAGSNAYSRPRLEFKQRALGWVRSVISRLGDINIAVDVHGSDEHPSVWNGHRVDCQWVFLWRDPAARARLDAILDQRQRIAQALNDPSPFFRHAFLALRLDSEKVEVCAQLHPNAWVDFETLRARLSDPEHASRIIQSLTDLPEQYGFGLFGEPKQPCSSTTHQGLNALLDRAANNSLALWVGWSVARDLAIEHSVLLDEQLEDALVALAPVYQHIAWSAHDDPAGIGARSAEMREELARASAQRAADLERQKAETDRQRRETTEKSRERTRERVEYAAPARARPSLGNLFKPDSAAATKPAAGSNPPPRAAATASRTQSTRPGSRRAAGPPARAATPERPASGAQPHAPHFEDSTDPVDKNSQVRVLAGPFAGKIGVVSEVDGRGGARVLLGLLSTRVPITQLAAVVESREQRPSLQTSHRRPGPIGRSGAK